MQKSRVLAGVLGVVLAGMIAGCGSGGGTAAGVTGSRELSVIGIFPPGDEVMTAGQSLSLTFLDVTNQPDPMHYVDGDPRSVNWTSSDPSVLAVEGPAPNGANAEVLDALKAGKVTVTLSGYMVSRMGAYGQSNYVSATGPGNPLSTSFTIIVNGPSLR